MMAKPITTILCDLDGTLIDSRRDITLAFQYALRCIVEGALPDETAIAQHIGKPLAHMAGQLGSFFQHIQGWVPGLQLKPAPDAVIAALAALRCAPQQALMVGDTPADILAGKAAGLKTCAVTYGFGTLKDLRHCQPDYVIDTFSDLVSLVKAREQS